MHSGEALLETALALRGGRLSRGRLARLHPGVRRLRKRAGLRRRARLRRHDASRLQLSAALRLGLRRADWRCALPGARCAWTSHALLLAGLLQALLLLSLLLLSLARTRRARP